MHLYVYNLVSNVSHFIFITNHFLINKNMCYDQIKKVTFTQCLFTMLNSILYASISLIFVFPDCVTLDLKFGASAWVYLDICFLVCKTLKTVSFFQCCDVQTGTNCVT